MGPSILSALSTVLQNRYSLSFILAFLALVCRRRTLSARKRYPPGPKPLPVIGNLHQLPKEQLYKTYDSWAKTYGPLLHFSIFGRHFIVLNDLKTAEDLMVKRSALYSTRPHMVMAGDLVGRQNNSVLFLKHGERLKDTRRIVTKWASKTSVQAANPVLNAVHKKFLAALLETPEDCFDHVRFAIGSLVLKLTYGIDCRVKGDPYIAMIEEMHMITSKAIQPGKWLCDSFPFLAKIPAWMPFAGFRRWAIESRAFIQRAVQVPFEFTRDSALRGEATSSWLEEMLLDENGKVVTGDAAENLWIAASALYTGAIDTTVSSIYTFLWMMARYPEVQRKAQQEIDSVIGLGRLPVPEDRESLPYINNVIKETLRFGSVAPITAHSLDEEDSYLGYRIPKGAWVIANMWSILHDSTVFKDPEEFRPERFEDTKEQPAEPDLVHCAFGFGRRACPGNHFAMVIVFMQVASMLSLFNIVPDGPLPDIEFEDGHIRMPHRFKFDLVPRSPARLRIICDDGEKVSNE